MKDKLQSGRPRITEDIRIQIICKLNRRLTALQIRADINHSISDHSEKTKSWWFKRLHNCQETIETNFHKKVAKCGWIGQQVTKIEHLRTFECPLDESKFEVFVSHRKTFVRRLVGQKMLAEFIVPTIKHGGSSVMVWGCFSTVGAGELIKIQ